MKVTNEGIENIKESIKNMISHAEYKSGNVWTKIGVQEVKTLPDGRIAIYIMLDENCANKITNIRIYNTKGQIWSEGEENIDKTNFNEGLLYRFTLSIKQTE